MNHHLRRRLAESITALERGDISVLSAFDSPSLSHIIGLTGSPGVGKSCLTSALVTELRARGRTVAVIAIDPSSPTTGGALLGDRLRMGKHRSDAAVYIRSIASRGHLGGASSSTPLVLSLLERAGFDTILVETVGVGQSETEIRHLADTMVWVTAPGLGDDIQAAKAGVLEVADVLVVNKSDLQGADETAEQLRSALHQAPAVGVGQWQPEVVCTSAVDESGISEFLDVLDRHLAAEGADARRALREKRFGQVLVELSLDQLRERILTAAKPDGRPLVECIVNRLARGEMELGDAVAHVVEAVTR